MHVITEARVPIKSWAPIESIEQSAIQQLINTANLPCIFKHMAAMPDVHYGIGATVGSVVPTVRAVIPACVGVDIGCGMIAAKLPFTASGIECKKDSSVLDEIPGSCKDIDTVMQNQADLVEIVAELKQVLCVKG